MFGAVAGSLLRAVRSARRVAPVVDATASLSTAKTIGEVAMQSSETEVGAVLHRLFDYQVALKYEGVIVVEKRYVVLDMLRALTPSRYKDLAACAGMTRADMIRFKEELAPEKHDDRSRYPLFAPF